MTARSLALRTARLVATFLIVTLATQFMLGLVPGEPAEFLTGSAATPELIANVNEQFHLDAPFFEQYGRWLGNLVAGDFGTSYISRAPVRELIVARLPVTLELATLATLLALVIAIPLAVVTAQRAGSRLDRAVNVVTSGMISLPSFVFAVLGLYLLAYRTRVFPIAGWSPLTEGVFQNLRSAFLPVLSIALIEIVVLQRVLRADLVETLGTDYIALAEAKGVPPRRIMWKHALRPSSFSLLTLSSLQFARLFGGTVIVETVFGLPGIGQQLILSINSKDIFVVQGVVTFVAIVFLVVNFAVDMLYGLIDPRTRIRAA